MSEPRDIPDHDVPTLDDVVDPLESAPRDRQEHGKAPAHVDDDELERRAQHERDAVHGD